VAVWVDRCHYLGAFLVSCRIFKCDFHHAKSRFFGAFNSLYSKVGRLASEEVILSLLQSKCLPILLYSTEVCALLSRDRQSLEFTITRIFMKIFRTSSSAIVKDCQCNFSFLPIQSRIDGRTARFLQRYVASENSLCSLFAANAASHLRRVALA